MNAIMLPSCATGVRDDSVRQGLAVEVFFFGDSFLLRRTLRVLKGRYDLAVDMQSQARSAHCGMAILIHDGLVPVSIRERFALDFDVRDYGSKADDVAEGLWVRLTSCLV